MEIAVVCPDTPQGHEAVARPRPQAWLRKVSRLWQRPAPQGEALDPSTGLLSAEALRQRAAPLLAAGSAPVTVVLFELGDLREVREIYGQRVRRAIMQQWVRKLRAAAGHRGLAARTGAEQFLLVLPGTSPEQAQPLLARHVGSPPRLEFDPRGLELVLVPDMVIEVAAEDERDIQPIHARLHAALEAQREAERRRQHYLELERARHSRPMPMLVPARRRR